MLTFDRLKIVASIDAIHVTDDSVFVKEVKEGVLLSMKYYQDKPNIVTYYLVNTCLLDILFQHHLCNMIQQDMEHKYEIYLKFLQDFLQLLAQLRLNTLLVYLDYKYIL